MQHATLGQRGVHHRPLYASPILGVALADDEDIERHPERAERSTETYHLGVPVLRVALYDQEVEVAVGAGVTAGTRTEEHDLDRIGSDGRQGLACGLDDLLRNHDDTVAKLPGGFALGGFRDNGLSAIGLPDRLRCLPPRLSADRLYEMLKEAVQAGVRRSSRSPRPPDGQ
jgi:hypothetical protein